MQYVNLYNECKQQLTDSLPSLAQMGSNVRVTDLLTSLRKYQSYLYDALPIQEDVYLSLEKALDGILEAVPTEAWISGKAGDAYDVATSAFYDEIVALIESHGKDRITPSAVLGDHVDSEKVLTLGMSNGLYISLGYVTMRQGNYIDYTVFNGAATSGELVRDKGFLYHYFGGIPLVRKFYPVPWKQAMPGFSALDLLNDAQQNLQINDVINNVASGITTNRVSLDWLQSLKDKINSRFVAARTLMTQVINGFCSGGAKGAIAAIVYWFATMKTYTVVDGYFTFSDNLDLVPKTYIINVLSIVFGVASTIIGLVVSIFSRVVGTILVGLGSVLWSLAGSFVYDADAQKASANLSDNAPVSWSPWVGWHGEFAVPDTAPIMAGLAAGCVIVEVPFGYVLAGKSGVSSNGHTPVKFEFHPSTILCGDVQTAWTNRGDSFLGQLFDITSNAAAWWEGTISIVPKDYGGFPPSGTAVWTVLHQLLNSSQGRRFDNAPNSLVLSDTADAIMRCHHLYVTGLSLLWMYYFGLKAAGVSVKLPTMQWGHSNGHNTIIFTESSGDALLDSIWEMIVLGCPINYALPSMEHWPMTYIPAWGDIAERQVVTIPASDYAWNIAYYWISHDDSWAAQHPIADPIGSIMPTSDGDQFALSFPQYDSRSFWTVVGVTIAVAVLTIAVTVFVSLRVKNFITRKRAESAAKVEHAWAQLTEEPTIENAENYRKAVKTHNLKTRLIGGNSLSTENYWASGGGDPDAEMASSSELINDLVGSEESAGLQTIIQLITGVPANS